MQVHTNSINYLQLFWRKKWLICFIACLTALGSVGFSLYSKPVYTGTSTLLIAFKDPVNTAGMGSTLSPLLQEEYMATQIGIISSKYMADKVFSFLHFDSEPELSSVYERFTQDESNDQVVAAAIKSWMLNNLKVYVYNSRTRLVKVAFKNENREVAIKISNAFAEQYLATALDLNLAPIRSSVQWIKESTQPIRKSLIQAEKMLSKKPSNEEIAEIDSLLGTTRHDLNTLMLILNNRGIDANFEQGSEFLLKVRSSILENKQLMIEKSKSLGPRDEELVAIASEAVLLKNEYFSEVKKQIDSMKVALASLNQSLVLRGSVTQSNVTLLNHADVDVESDHVAVSKAAIYGAILGVMLGLIIAFFSIINPPSKIN